MKVLDGSDNYSNLGANAVLECLWQWQECSNSLELPLYRYFKVGAKMPVG